MRHLYSCFFALGRDNKYPRMAAVLQRTAEAHCREWQVTVETIFPHLTEQTTSMSGRRVLSTNIDKLGAWVDKACSLPDGDELVLCDADMMVMKPLDPLWELPFDFAYCRKQGASRLPINGGLVALRINDRSRAFMRHWLAVNNRHFEDPGAHQPWRDMYAGANQAALGCMLDTEDHPAANIRVLRCVEWNNCYETSWCRWRDARVVHIKSGLRRSVFGSPRNRGIPADVAVRELTAIWQGIDAEIRRDADIAKRAAGVCAR